MKRGYRAILVVAFACLTSRHSFAQDPPRKALDPNVVQGMATDPSYPGDAARRVLDVVLWLPRRAFELVYATTENAAGLVEHDQIVPRARELFVDRDAGIGLYPTLSLGGGFAPIVGVRMVSGTATVATTMLATYGDRDDYATESRIRVGTAEPLPIALSFEGLHDVRSGIGFSGIGQNPASDPRNVFLMGPAAGSYKEDRERVLVSAGLRPASDLEVFASRSYTERYIEDARDGVPLSQVFAPPSDPGAYERTKLIYSEVAVRLDTRSSRSAPVPGSLLELYGGTTKPTHDDVPSFQRLGGRAATYLSVYRPTNILSPHVNLDLLTSNQIERVPFEELPDDGIAFRGAGDRRDHLSLVWGLDYRWRIAKPVAGRIFTDFAEVSPRFSALTAHDVRWTVGLGADLFNDDAFVGQVALAAGPDGARFLFVLGVSSPFGDRQHRN